MFITEQHKIDLEYGENAENTIQSKLENHLDCKLNKTCRNCRYDFCNENKDIIVEMKSRRCNKNNYPTTIIPSDKWFYLKQLYEKGASLYYVFNFKDKNCIYKYEGEDFNSKIINRQDQAGKLNRKHIEIPISRIVDF